MGIVGKYSFASLSLQSKDSKTKQKKRRKGKGVSESDTKPEVTTLPDVIPPDQEGGDSYEDILSPPPRRETVKVSSTNFYIYFLIAYI